MTIEQEDPKSWAASLKKALEAKCLERVALLENAKVPDERVSDILEGAISTVIQKTVGLDSWGRIERDSPLGKVISENVTKTWKRMAAFGKFQSWIDEAIATFLAEHEDVLREFIFERVEDEIITALEDSWGGTLKRILEKYAEAYGEVIGKAFFTEALLPENLEKELKRAAAAAKEKAAKEEFRTDWRDCSEMLAHRNRKTKKKATAKKPKKKQKSAKVTVISTGSVGTDIKVEEYDG
jgi:hypothetical protein